MKWSSPYPWKWNSAQQTSISTGNSLSSLSNLSDNENLLEYKDL